MTRYDVRTQVLAVFLSSIAGFVDATAFQEFGGVFVSFMSGNTTRLGVGLAAHTGWVGVAAGLIAAFVCGAALGSLLGRWARARRRPVVLMMVAGLLSLAAWLGPSEPSVFLMALAMGAENAVFEEDGEVRLGLTYMTGALAKTGQKLAAAMTGGSPMAWAPYLLLWAGLMFGAVAGAATSANFGVGGSMGRGPWDSAG